MGRLPVGWPELADPSTRNAPIKEVDGIAVRLKYVQAPRRDRSSGGRRKSTWYIYEVAGSGQKLAYRNKGPQDWYFLPMGGTMAQKRRYYDIFIRPPLTDSEKSWLAMKGYVAVGESR